MKNKNYFMIKIKFISKLFCFFLTVTTSCTVPISPENGHMTCRTPHHRPVKSKNILPDGTICHYKCSTGYHIPPSQEYLASVYCFAGQWNSTQDPICISKY